MESDLEYFRRIYMADTVAEGIERIKWRASLNEYQVRSLCYDFLTGMRDHCTFDAYEEYIKRFGMPSKSTRSIRKLSPGARPHDSAPPLYSAITDQLVALPGTTIIG